MTLILNCRVLWLDPQKQKQKFVDVGPSIAMFIAKKKIFEGMQDVTIKIYPDAKGEEEPPPLDIETTNKEEADGKKDRL